MRWEEITNKTICGLICQQDLELHHSSGILKIALTCTVWHTCTEVRLCEFYHVRPFDKLWSYGALLMSVSATPLKFGFLSPLIHTLLLKISIWVVSMVSVYMWTQCFCFYVIYSDTDDVFLRACTVTLPACCTATWWRSHQRTGWRTSSPKLWASSRSASDGGNMLDPNCLHIFITFSYSQRNKYLASEISVDFELSFQIYCTVCRLNNKNGGHFKILTELTACLRVFCFLFCLVTPSAVNQL